jgi:ATP-dependent DNA helicase RecG
MGALIMNSLELNALVNDVINLRSETNFIELKKAFTETPKRLYDTLSSFSNQTGGGIIIFGIDEDDNYNICGVYDANDLQKQITEQANQMEPIVRPLISVTQINGKAVVSAEIPECDVSERPCYYKGAGKVRGSYIRVGDADLHMTEYEIYSYEAYRRRIQDELREVSGDIASRLDDKLIKFFLAKLRILKPNLSILSDEEALNVCGILKDSKPTLAGLLLFGLIPQANFPALDVTAVVVPGTSIGMTSEDGARFTDNKRFDGTIPQMLDDTMNFVNRVIKTRTIINEQGKRADTQEYPAKAIREIILNALIHRDYSINTERTPVRILFFSDRLEVENPGGLYGRLTIDELGKIGADTRNPNIAAALEILINTENRYSGIPTIRYEMEAAELPPPLFESSRGVFRVTLYNKEHEEQKKLNKVNKISFNITAEDEKTEEKMRKILEFCKEPKSRSQISEYTQILSVSYLNTKYLTPLIKSGNLKMTIPEKPKSRYQRFYTVKK